VEGQNEIRIFLPTATAKTGLEGIIFCLRGSVFFCSQEHAAEERRRHGGLTGIYLTMEQSMATVRDLMNAIFGFG
jgi:hypothetical protein